MTRLKTCAEALAHLADRANNVNLIQAVDGQARTSSAAAVHFDVRLFETRCLFANAVDEVYDRNAIANEIQSSAYDMQSKELRMQARIENSRIVAILNKWLISAFIAERLASGLAPQRMPNTIKPVAIQYAGNVSQERDERLKGALPGIRRVLVEATNGMDACVRAGIEEY